MQERSWLDNVLLMIGLLTLVALVVGAVVAVLESFVFPFLLWLAGVGFVYLTVLGVVFSRRRRRTQRLLHALSSRDDTWDPVMLERHTRALFNRYVTALTTGDAEPLRDELTDRVHFELRMRSRAGGDRSLVGAELHTVTLVGVDDQPGEDLDSFSAWLVGMRAAPAGAHYGLPWRALWRFARRDGRWVLAEAHEGAAADAKLVTVGSTSAELDAVPPGALSRATGHERDDDRGLSLTNRPD